MISKAVRPFVKLANTNNRSKSSLMRDIMLSPNGLAQARMNDNLMDWFDNSFSRSRSNINVDIVEKEKEYEIYADLPGFEKSDIKVSANNHILTIEGQMTHDEKYDDSAYIRRERASTRFSRSFNLPMKSHSGKISAKMNNGVLEMHVPKAEEHDLTQISIK